MNRYFLQIIFLILSLAEANCAHGMFRAATVMADAGHIDTRSNQWNCRNRS